MQTYFLDEGELMLEIAGGAASVDFWSDTFGCYVALDVTPATLQEFLDQAGLKMKVGQRLGWREMGSEYSNAGYFAVLEAVL